MGETLGKSIEQPANPVVEFLTPEKTAEFRQAMIEACKAACDDSADEIISEFLEQSLEEELTFVRDVMTAYQRWAQEKNVLVLWDVDDTMGERVHDGVWGFRVSLLALMQFLKEKYPNIKNGILTNRTVAKEQLADPTELQPIRKFMDEEHVYSSRDFVPNMEDYERAEILEIEAEDLADATHTRLSGDFRDKYALLKTLKEKGINPKIIDDNGIAKALKEDGVYLYHAMADRNFVTKVSGL